MAVRLEAVRPKVIAHLTPGFLDMRGQPRQHNLKCCGFSEILVCFLLRLPERFEKRLGYPSILLVSFPANDHRVHDGKNSRAAEVITLDLSEIFEKAFYGAIRMMKRRRYSRRVKRI